MVEQTLAERIVAAVVDGQRQAQRYSSNRIGTCPPSREFPIDRSLGGWDASRRRQLALWEAKYPHRDIESFTIPAVQAVLDEAQGDWVQVDLDNGSTQTVHKDSYNLGWNDGMTEHAVEAGG